MLSYLYKDWRRAVYEAVSYTPLTLPTKRLCYILVSYDR